MADSSIVLMGERAEVRPTKKPRRWGNFLLTTFTLFTFAFLYIPIAVLILFSFNSARGGAEWRGFTLQWYQRMFSNDDIIQATISTLTVATLSTIGATIIGTLTALAMERYQFKSKTFWDGLLYMPVIVPEIVAGVSLLLFFAFIGIDRGLVTLVIAHIAFSMPFVYVTVRARLADFDRRVEEAAYDLGANEFETFKRVTFPLLLPGIISGALLAFTLSLDDFIISFFVTGEGWNTLPVYIWALLKKSSSSTGEVNAISALLLLISILVVTVSLALQRKNTK